MRWYLSCFLICYFALNAQTIQNYDPNVCLIMTDRGYGMFSAFDDIFDSIFYYEMNQYTGIEIDFDKTGLYYDPEHGDNWWNYYFEPIKLGESSIIQRGDCLGRCSEVFRILGNDRKRMFEFITKYFRMKDHVKNKIDTFVQANFTGYFVISIHYRGTDKFTSGEALPVDYALAHEAVRLVMQAYGNLQYKIFLATDEQAFIDYMVAQFGDVVCYNHDAIRSKDGTPVHLDKNYGGYKKGEDALVDCLLLAKGNFLIRCASNLSRWSTYFNPDIPAIKLNEQWDGL